MFLRTTTDKQKSLCLSVLRLGLLLILLRSSSSSNETLFVVVVVLLVVLLLLREEEMNEGNAGVEKAVESFILSEDFTQTFIT